MTSNTESKPTSKKPKINTIKVLFIGDIVGRPGRRAVREYLTENRKNYDLVFANAENLSAGRGITKEKYAEALGYGIDYFTSGNHIWNYKEFIEELDNPEVKVLRPANYPANLPGRGYAGIDYKGIKILLLNLQGRVFIKDELDDPFTSALNLISREKNSIIIIDFHAEATSEKVALGYYLDGKVSAVIGTHTHVQTADEQILAGGTGYITDVGMCGPKESVLGVEKEIIIEKFLTQLPLSHKVARGDSVFNAVELTIDIVSKKTISIKRVNKVFLLK